MPSWFHRLFSTSASAAPTVAAAAPGPPAVAPPATPSAAPATAPLKQRHAQTAAPSEIPSLTQADIDFLDGLVAPPLVRRMEEFSKDDQFFLAGISKRLHLRDLEMPQLPAVAIRLSEMLRQDSRPIDDYVTLLNQDTLLSVEVLRAANSAAFAALPTTNLKEAVMRIGLSRVQSILMLAHLRARIIKNGVAQRQAELLLDLAVSIAILAGRVLPTHGAADSRFMRGMLLHMEHMVILGAIGDVSRERHAAILPSVAALHQAFWRYGPQIREVLTASWKLDQMLDGNAEAGHEAYLDLRQTVVSRWLDRELPAVEAVGSISSAR